MPNSTTTAMLTNPSAPTSKEEGTKATDPTSLSTLEYKVRIFLSISAAIKVGNVVFMVWFLLFFSKHSKHKQTHH